MRRLFIGLLVVAAALTAFALPAGASTPTSVTATFAATGGGAPTYGSGTTVSGAVTGAGGIPTGTVTVTEGATTLGSGPLSNGAYQISLPLLSAGNHTITVQYGGDDSTFAANQMSQLVVVGRADTTVSATGPDWVWIGLTADYTITVSRIPAATQPSAAPSGTVVVHAPGLTGTVYATVPLSGGVAHVSVPASAAPNAVYFDYSGDSNYNPGSTAKSLSGPNKYGLNLTLTDTHGCTPNVVVAPCTTPVPGYPMLLGVGLDPKPEFPQPPAGMEPSGTITFSDVTEGTTLGTAPLVHGVAVIATYFTSPGSHAVLATYNGDANFQFAQSNGYLYVTVLDAGQIQRYVNWVYLDLLGRDGDPGGIAYWTGLLDMGTPRAATSWALVNSDEFRADMISSMYEQFLERGTDQGGLNYWVGRVGAGMTFEQFQSMLIGSDEYFQKASKGNSDNTTFVRSMYQDVLGRAIDPSGQAYFLSLLANGTPRSQVVAAVVYSTEHLSTTVDGYYMWFLGRHSDPGGNAYWTSQLQHGARDELIIALIIGSDEYFYST